MNINNCFSKFKPEIWRVQSEIVRRKAMEINERIEAVLEDSEVQSDVDDDEDNPKSGKLCQKYN